MLLATTVDKLFNLFFSVPSQNVTILENKGSEDIVNTVTADPNVTDVHYTFIKPYPPFTIGRGKELPAAIFVVNVILKQQHERTIY